MPYNTYVDCNNLIKINYDIIDNNVQYNYTCDLDKGTLDDTIVENLTSISRLDETDNPDIARISINDVIFVDISKSSGQATVVKKLITFETRLLAQGKPDRVPLVREMVTDFKPKTDLHTHFAGAIPTDVLIDAGIKNDIAYPINLLEKIDIDTSKYTRNNNKVSLKDLSDKDMEALKSKLMISPITQETFNNMEEVYAMRAPFTKNKTLFIDLMKGLAKDYQKNGIEYAELSFSAFLQDTDYLKMCQEELPGIEKETGVRMRFLAGMWRHSQREWNLDDVDRIKSIAKCPYVVGCDFMGHETNSTDDFKDELETLARFAMEEKPDFSIRVHAGENPMFRDNVKKALEIVYDTHKQYEETNKQKYSMPKVRIGHGLYGVNDEVLDMAKEMDAIIEFNMSSNLSLNNINSISEVPIKKYLDRGVKVVLATDGHGIYLTNGEQETILATNAGLTAKDFDKIKSTEEHIIKSAFNKDEHAVEIEQLNKFIYHTNNGEKRWNKEVEQRYKSEDLEIENILQQKVSDIGASASSDEVDYIKNNKMPILLTGASKSNWPNILPEDQEYIKVLTQVIADNLDADKAYIITGGTNFGVEKQMHQAVNRRNLKNEKQLNLLGTITMEATQEEDCGLDPNTVTHVIIPEIDGRKAKTWQELPDTQLQYLRGHNGIMLAIGGGGVVGDMIQRAHNMSDIDINLMKGPYGAATKESIAFGDNGYSFETIEEFMTKLRSKHPNMLREGFKLEEINKYIAQAKDEIRDGRVQTDKYEGNSNFGLGAVSEIDKQVSRNERLELVCEIEKELKGKENINEYTR